MGRTRLHSQSHHYSLTIWVVLYGAYCTVHSASALTESSPSTKASTINFYQHSLTSTRKTIKILQSRLCTLSDLKGLLHWSLVKSIWNINSLIDAFVESLNLNLPFHLLFQPLPCTFFYHVFHSLHLSYYWKNGHLTMCTVQWLEHPKGEAAAIFLYDPCNNKVNPPFAKRLSQPLSQVPKITHFFN